jgi:hypothetical protein
MNSFTVVIIKQIVWTPYFTHQCTSSLPRIMEGSGVGEGSHPKAHQEWLEEDELVGNFSSSW